MSPVHFADSSAIVRAYLEDEPGHVAFERLVLSGEAEVVSTELAGVEVPRALIVARRTKRILDRTMAALLESLRQATEERRVIQLLPLDPRPTLSRAAELVREHPLGTLDAIHLAVADREGRALAGDDGLIFVTADTTQAAAARAMGLAVLP